jgi:hypothetical protein
MARRCSRSAETWLVPRKAGSSGAAAADPLGRAVTNSEVHGTWEVWMLPSDAKNTWGSDGHRAPFPRTAAWI